MPLDNNWMDRRDRADKRHFGRRPSARERGRERLLKLWFGTEQGAREVLAHQSCAKPLGEVIDDVMKSVGLERAALLDRLRDEWPRLVGADIAKASYPAALYKQQLDIEVQNASWLYVLETMHKNTIRERVKDFTDNLITEIRFAPAGRKPAPSRWRTANGAGGSGKQGQQKKEE